MATQLPLVDTLNTALYYAHSATESTETALSEARETGSASEASVSTAVAMAQESVSLLGVTLNSGRMPAHAREMVQGAVDYLDGGISTLAQGNDPDIHLASARDGFTTAERSIKYAVQIISEMRA